MSSLLSRRLVKDSPEAEVFAAPSKPRPYKQPQRDLPPLQRRWPIILAFSTVGVASWGAFLAWSHNQERLHSSIVRQILENLRDSPELNAVLGDAIRPEPIWWLNGDPWINGSVHMMQGNIDVSFRIKGHRGITHPYAGSGTLYFTSIRKAKGEPFTIIRYKVIADDGTEVDIPSQSH
ncbi:DUF1783-domain-containing protein [Laetiporus sulphureus 93-53]|uniref:DUF1783-domain-containing protein n=1 Tax=Laetiporus sulphureus 93-53 TaxID=1314785 RepID=A0A165FED7_9APHY|nr:DUF1783-domain-containing protein [Laetiporus sulphureus 93-53]KZT08842.1 DUF1783-domain-containing protein [Laetiporus sulphureus 93-53]